MQGAIVLRRHHSVSLNRASWGRGSGDNVDPNSSLTNIADCMLVLMLGFLVALVARYNIDLVPLRAITTWWRNRNPAQLLHRLTKKSPSS